MEDLEALAKRHDVPVDAARHLRDALTRGHGRMAQFNHPALGGMGQWHDGGMMMIGDMFNDALKAKIGAFLRDLAPLAAATAPASDESGTEWPHEFGAPSSSGAQNGVRYAFFPSARRLMIVQGDHAETYDTGDHAIGGVSQQQGGSSDLAFTSQHGPVRLSELTKVDAPASPSSRASALKTSAEHQPSPRANETTSASVHALSSNQSSSRASAEHRDDFATLERLAELHRKQALTDEEYKAKKAEILARF